MKKDVFQYYASVDAEFIHGGKESATNTLLQHIDIKPYDTILDFGCGSCSTLIKISSRYPHSSLTGIDRSEFMISKSRKSIDKKRIKNIKLIRSLDFQLPFDDNTFDHIIAESVLSIQNIEDLSVLFKEFYRILKPTGKMGINESIWDPSITKEEAESINGVCLHYLGINQAQSYLKGISDWIDFMECVGFKNILKINEDQIPIAKRPVKGWRNYAESIKKVINPQINAWRRAIRLVQAQFVPGKKYLTYFILIFDKKDMHP